MLLLLFGFLFSFLFFSSFSKLSQPCGQSFSRSVPVLSSVSCTDLTISLLCTIVCKYQMKHNVLSKHTRKSNVLFTRLTSRTELSALFRRFLVLGVFTYNVAVFTTLYTMIIKFIFTTCRVSVGLSRLGATADDRQKKESKCEFHCKW